MGKRIVVFAFVAVVVVAVFFLSAWATRRYADHELQKYYTTMVPAWKQAGVFEETFNGAHDLEESTGRHNPNRFLGPLEVVVSRYVETRFGEERTSWCWLSQYDLTDFLLDVGQRANRDGIEATTDLLSTPRWIEVTPTLEEGEVVYNFNYAIDLALVNHTRNGRELCEGALAWYVASSFIQGMSPCKGYWRSADPQQVKAFLTVLGHHREENDLQGRPNDWADQCYRVYLKEVKGG